MAKNRMVNTRFWNDGFISKLDPIEKLLFIYFITNEHTNICGIYELPLKIAAIETGIDSSMFEKILPRLKDKIQYIDGYVCMKNFPKYQASDQPTVLKGIEIALAEIPNEILVQAIAYGYPIDRLPITPDSPAKYSNPNLNSNIKKGSETKVSHPLKVIQKEEPEEDTEMVPCDDEGNPIKKKKQKVSKSPEEFRRRATDIREKKLKPYSFEDELNKLRESTWKPNKIVALVWKRKGYHFENAEQFSNNLARDVKLAKQLEGYTSNQIHQTIDECEKEASEVGYSWGVVTIAKKIANIVNR